MPPRVVFALSLLLAAGALAEPPSAQVLERYRQMLAANPSEGTALDRLWKAYVEAGRTGELIAEYGKGGTFADKMVLGLLQHRAGRDDEAAAAFKAASGLDAASPLPVLALAGLGKGAEAAALYERALAMLPAGDARLPAIQETLGRAWFAAGDPERASAAWERTVALDPANTELRRRLAETYRQNRLPDRALTHLEHLAAHAPANERAAAYQEISRQYQSLRRADEAIRALEQAVALTSPGNWLWSDLQGQLIRLYQRFGRTAELEEKWKRQAAANPRDLGALLQLTECYQRLGDLEQERVWLEKLTALAPKTPAYRWRLARVLVELDRRPEAAALYDTLLTEQPGNIDAAFERAKLEIVAGAPEKAHARLAAVLRLKSADDSVRGRALEFYQQHRLWQDAEDLLRSEAASNSEEAISALANFAFSRHREAEGEATLRRLIPAKATPRQRAAALVRIAQMLRNQNLLEPAARSLAEAAPLAVGDPKQQREISLMLGETLAALGNHSSARLSYLEAVNLSQSPAQQEEVEQRLFDTLRQLMEERPTPAPAPRVNPAEEASIAVTNPWIGHYIADLTQEAQAHPSEQAWLRVARWKAWCHDAEPALEDLSRALALNPKSLAAHEAAVKVALAGPTPIAARWHLEALLELDPANAIAYRRRLALLDQQNGQLGEAIRTLALLAADAPGNVDLLIDLANVQQRAERWEDALATWQRILAGGSSARRPEAVGALLRIYERLNRPQPEAELLLAEFDTRPDAKEQLETFKELLKLCERAGLLPWLHTQWAARREGRLDDATGEIAWAQLLKAEGDGQGAFTALSATLFTAPNPADTLPELVRQAEELRRLDAAIDFQTRLVRLGSQGRPEALMKLAELQERDFAIEPAAQTWALVVARFPRDAAALYGAVEFHLRSGERTSAARLLRRVRELEPNDTRALFQLARLDLREGALKEAEACLEQILQNVEATGMTPIRFPAMKHEEFSRLQAAYLRGLEQRGAKPQAETMRALRGFWVEAAADHQTEDDLRLSAIRELAGLVRAKDDPALLQKWILRWRNTEDEDAGEVLWALYYANAGAATLDYVEQLMAKEPANEQYQQGYFWLGLQLREFKRLAAWTSKHRGASDRRDFVTIALAQYLQITPGWVDPELLRAFTSGGEKGLLWEFAQLCSTNMCFAEAVELGRREFAARKRERAPLGWELAQWELALGHPAEAQRLLTEVARMPGDGFQAPAYTALRAAILLLPPGERMAFAERAEHDLAGAPPLHASITRILVRALSGREAEARSEVRRLARMRVVPPLVQEDYEELAAGKSIAGKRSWNFIHEAGQQLRTWGLDSLAQTFWEEALADPALIRLQGDNVRETAREVRLELLALQVAHAGRDEVAELLERSERGPQALEPGTGLGDVLEQMRALPRAVEVYFHHWRRDPSNGQVLRNLLNACRIADDTATAETALQVSVSQRLFALNDNVHRDLVMQLTDLLERRGALAEARKVVSKAVEASPYDTRLLLRLAQLPGHDGVLADAERLWRRVLAADPSHTAGQLGLADLLARTGERSAAIKVLQKGTSPGVETKLAELLYAEGRTEAAISVVERVSGTDRLAAPRALAAAMLAKGDRHAARAILQSAVTRTTDPAAAMKLQSLLLESLAAPEESVLIARELLKLRQMAGDDPGRLGVYFAFVHTHAVPLGFGETARRELAAAWSDGTGLLQAGLVLLTWRLETAPGDAETVLTQILARRDVGEPSLKSMLPALETARRPDLAARVEQRLLRLTPGDFELLLSAVRHFDAAGQRENAVALMKGWGARAFVDESVARLAAQAWIALGEDGTARQLYDAVAPPRGVLRGYEPYLDHAQFRLAAGDFGPAKALLLRAFEHPGNREYARVIDWLAATDRLDRWENEFGEFRFTETQKLGVKRTVFERYAALPNVGKVVALVEAQPALIDAERFEMLRATAKRTGAFGEIAGLMERALAQATEPALSLSYVLTLADWAETEPPAAALARLHAAQTRRPDVYPLSERLHALHRARGEPAEARAAIQRYLSAADPDAPERAQAEKLAR